jgi:hypothetical protein
LIIGGQNEDWPTADSNSRPSFLQDGQLN